MSGSVSGRRIASRAEPRRPGRAGDEAYAVGDAHTNLQNPFWALPLLAITRIAREMFVAPSQGADGPRFLAVGVFVLPS